METRNLITYPFTEKNAMDSITNYPGFEQDIKEVFASINKDYSFLFSKKYDGCYELKNAYCILRFTFDRGDINCNIRPILSKEPWGEGVFPILGFLFRNDKALEKGKIYDFRPQLVEYAEILSTKLKNVIQGDFSWLEPFLVEKEELRKMIAFVWNEVNIKSPIYFKFKSGDLSWKEDLKSYLLEHNITL